MTKNKNDKTTPLYSANLVMEYLTAPPFIDSHGENPAKHQRNIIQALNQFEALQAVADAAESVLPFIQRIRSSHSDGGNTIADNLLNSLANLQTVRSK